MNRTRTKAMRKARLRAGTRQKRKPAARPKPAAEAGSKLPEAASPVAAEPIDAMIAAAIRMLDLPVDPSWKPAIKAHLQITLGHAALVAEFVLPDDAEPAPVFTA